ncbi:hypothetical protein F4808DRAFT_441388 [Astrocystis sublimbata]|nr:hypothetical protein F4808DRAFT_441388 [Astrocystis sublimbata]
MEAMNDVVVHECNGSDGDGADMIFDLNGKRIAVSFFPSPGVPGGKVEPGQHHACIEDSIIQRINQAIFADDEEHEEIMDRILETVLDVGKSVFDEVAPANKVVSPPTEQDLHSLLYPPVLTYRLMTVESTPTLVAIDPSEAHTLVEPTFDEDTEEEWETDDNLPKYPPSQITILKSFVQGGGHTVSRVLVNKKEMLCKAQSQGLCGSDLRRELDSMQKIRHACLQGHGPIRVPALLGYVTHPEAGCIIGFLREWVLGSLLRNVSISTTPEEQRQMWAKQISDTLQQLHGIDVIWGDGKSSNVIIDEEDAAWLIDFGGGFTEGWVSQELAGTVEGDDQAVKKIAEFLGVGDKESKM